MFLQAVEEYVTTSASKSDLDRTSVGKGKKKTGTDTGAMAVHPISGEKVKQFLLAIALLFFLLLFFFCAAPVIDLAEPRLPCVRWP